MHILTGAFSPTLSPSTLTTPAANEPVHDPVDGAPVDTTPSATHAPAMPDQWPEHVNERRMAGEQWRSALQRIAPPPHTGITRGTNRPHALNDLLQALTRAWREAARSAPSSASFGGDPTDTDTVSRANGLRQANAYREVLFQMTPLVGPDAAHEVAETTSKLVPIAQRVDEIDTWIESRGRRHTPAALLEQRDAIAAALVNYDVYFDHVVPQILPSRVQRLENHDDNGSGQSGHFAAVYADALSNKIIVANRGTEIGIAGRASVDWMHNIRQALGLTSTQYDKAVGLARSLAWTYGAKTLVFTGHSLGGGLATAQTSVVPGSRGLTFDSAGLHNRTVARHSASPASSRITAYYVDGEALSLLQETVKHAERLAMHFPLVGKAMGWVSRLMIPRPVGQRIGVPAALPPVAPEMRTDVSRSSATSQARDVGNASDIDDPKRDIRPARGVLGAIEKHTMPQMIHALFDRLPKRTGSREDIGALQGVAS
ncbi:hypothetical protein UC34_14495 [Pandoraea vervacti]|uniref:Fungal lipase-like domain-containing protein n=1 Tax=Pandoraea vervacti TaxID=656178 RepID=A0ABM5SZ18_9BURK|nr:DUF2974 domain-containing protein [Pandoraea vervacti]AJP57862.1 hypothetical protein UC34_14495 [Pandoraea vervacti]